MSFRERISRFLYGRYGIDQLFYCLFALYIVLALVNMFVMSSILSFVMAAVAIYTFYRAFSKKVYKRQRENNIFLKYFGKLKRFAARRWRAVKEFKTHIRRICPNCKAKMRLKRIKGNHEVACPRCGKEFGVKSWF